MQVSAGVEADLGEPGVEYAFYHWLRRSNGYPTGQTLPTDAIDLEREGELRADHLDDKEMALVWAALECGEENRRVCDRAIIAVLSHRLRASEASALNMEH